MINLDTFLSLDLQKQIEQENLSILMSLTEDI